MNTTIPLILASASPRRKELLARLGVKFSVQVSDIDETPFSGETPLQMTERLAIAKAQAISSNVDFKAWVMGSDTTVALDDRVFGKPASRAEAVETLRQLSGNTHQVISSVSLLSSDQSRTPICKSVISRVSFGALSEKQIAAYCDTKEPYDKAGSYGIQGVAGSFVEHIDGDYSAIMGLPLWTTGQMLRKVGLLS